MNLLRLTDNDFIFGSTKKKVPFTFICISNKKSMRLRYIFKVTNQISEKKMILLEILTVVDVDTHLGSK